jgi:hypothetical protein
MMLFFGIIGFFFFIYFLSRFLQCPVFFEYPAFARGLLIKIREEVLVIIINYYCYVIFTNLVPTRSSAATPIT